MTPNKMTHILTAGRGIPAGFVDKAKAAAEAMKDSDEKSALVKAIAAADTAPEDRAKTDKRSDTKAKPAKVSVKAVAEAVADETNADAQG